MDKLEFEKINKEKREKAVSDFEILKRIKIKLDNHDKSLFTAFELNLLRDVIDYHLKFEDEIFW